MDKLNASIKSLPDSYAHTATAISQTGAVTYSGPNTHKIHSTNLPPESPLFNVFWDFNHRCSPGQGNHLNSPPLTLGYNAVRRFGMRLTHTFREQFSEHRNKPIVTVVPIQITNQANGFGCPLGTFVSDYPARSSVPGTWIHSKSLDKSLLFHFA